MKTVNGRLIGALQQVCDADFYWEILYCSLYSFSFLCVMSNIWNIPHEITSILQSMHLLVKHIQNIYRSNKTKLQKNCEQKRTIKYQQIIWRAFFLFLHAFST